MPTIGETLREGRMRQRLDIADVEQRTKIRAKYLRALENEEFSMLPGPTFVKTFLRTYAELLGLDPHLLVEEYRAHYEPRDDLETLKPLGPQTSTPRERRRAAGGGPGPFLAVALIAAALLVGLLVLGLTAGEDDGDGDGDGRAQTTETSRPDRTTPRERTRRRRATPSRVVLRIAPSTPTYVCVDGGPGTGVRYEDTLESPRTFRGRRLRVNIGKSAVDVRKNGRRVPIAQGPDAVGLDFTPTTTRPIADGERPCA